MEQGRNFNDDETNFFLDQNEALEALYLILKDTRVKNTTDLDEILEIRGILERKYENLHFLESFRERVSCKSVLKYPIHDLK